MTDLIEDIAPGDNAPEFSVSEISGAVKKTLEGAFGRIRVRGEVGRVFKARSGHLYFDIKDDRSVLASVSWKGQLSALTVVPEEGMEVVASGRLTTFGSQSKYQLNVEQVEPAGVGALMAMLEKRKKQLQTEGLFADERKRPIPYLPEVIGVVTSPSGAVIRDILHRLRDRFPRRVLVWPVAVQGRDCAPQVAAAIEGFNRLSPGGALPRPDVLIVARGGGSIEDLWGFNEEIVARAAAASQIPLISAVGHETDTTLIDFVSDRRAPTPTAAAEMAVPVRLDLLAHLDKQNARLSAALSRGLQVRRQRLQDLSRALPRVEELTRPAAQRLDVWSDRLPRALTAMVQKHRTRLAGAAAVLRPATLAGQQKYDRTRLTRADERLKAALVRAVERRRLVFSRHGAALRMKAAVAAQMTDLRGALRAADRLHESLSHKATLARGYAIARAEGAVVTSASAAQGASALSLEFHDGTVAVTPGSGSARKGGAAPRGGGGKQGSLFDD